MSETADQVRLIIAGLEHVRKRPLMFVTGDKNSVLNFLNGFWIGANLSGIVSDASDQDEIYHQVIQEHGWDLSSMHIIHQMEIRGYSLEKTIDETLLIYIEILKRRYKIGDSVEKQDHETDSG